MAYDWSNTNQYKPPAGNQAPASPSYTFGTTADKTAARQQVASGGSPGAASGPGYMSFAGGAPGQQQKKPAYQATQAPYGFDQTQPGQGEQYWNNNQNLWQQSPQLDWAAQQLPNYQNPTFGEQYNQNNIGNYAAPGQGQQFWNQVAGSFNTTGQYNGPNQSNAAYNQSVQNNPGSLSGDFNTAYDRATKEAIGAADQSAAARGAYGSSSALNNVGNVAADMAANKAKAATDFAIQNSQQQNQWQNTINNAARGADVSSLQGFGANLQGLGQFGDMAFNAEGANRAGNQLASGVASDLAGQSINRMNSGINAATGLDSSYLNRTNSGFNAASGAQGLQSGRAQGAFNNQNSYLNNLMNFLGGQYGGMETSDQQAMQDSWNAMLGGTQNAQNNMVNDRNAGTQSLNDALGLYKGLGGSFGGGGTGTGGGAPTATQSPLFQRNPSW